MLSFTSFLVIWCQNTIVSSQREGGDGFSHFSYCSSLHLATDTATTKVLANPGFRMKIDVRGLVPASHT